MHPIGFKIPFYMDTSIRVEQWNKPHTYETVHYHEEHQLTYIINGKGTLLVGSDQHEFVTGEIFLFGKNLPHAFRDEEKYIQNKDEKGSRKISIFFKKDCFNSLLEQYHETFSISKLLANNFYGIKLYDNIRLDILAGMIRLSKAKDFERVLELL